MTSGRLCQFGYEKLLLLANDRPYYATVLGYIGQCGEMAINGGINSTDRLVGNEGGDAIKFVRLLDGDESRNG